MNLQDFSINLPFLLLIPVVLISLAVHEFAHAFVANIFGDPTAKLEGRHTINPFAHWDRIGTTLLVGLLFLNGLGLRFPVFGWGKPVPVDESNFDNPKIQGLQTAFAGPISNFLLAIIFATLAHLNGLSPVLQELFVSAVFLNIFLMFFNLIPVPPLDGSRILRLFMSEHTYASMASNPVLLVGLIIVVFSFLLTYIAELSSILTTRLVSF